MPHPLVLASQFATNRRQFILSGASLAVLPWMDAVVHATERQSPSFSNDPFQLGVASGDPADDGVVLWTRLAPEPMLPGGGLPPEPYKVAWQVAVDDSMQQVVREGTCLATPQLGHSVHVELTGLKPDRWYWYRFRAGDAESPIGRTRTLPQPTALPKQLKFAFASCQNYEQGLFTAYEQMARDEVDLVFHLGDYIYEYEAGHTGSVRTHQGAELRSLEDYRIRHAQYRADALLHGMHAQCPWFVTWDDHEFDNNCASDVSEEAGIDPVEFLVRRANAYQAYYEMMPLRRQSLPRGPEMQLYRRASYGRLAELMVLDTRQYRSDQPNNDRNSPLNGAAWNSANSILGHNQRNWLLQNLNASQAIWNVLAQQVMMAMVGFRGDGNQPTFSMDKWTGYAAERTALLQFMAERRVPNPVVLTGDIHSNWVNELRIDDRRAETSPVATEFVATSISSGGNGVQHPAGLEKLMSDNPCVRFHNDERGYVRCTVTPENWRADYMVVDDIVNPGGKVFPRASFVVEKGDPSAKPA